MEQSGTSTAGNLNLLDKLLEEAHILRLKDPQEMAAYISAQLWYRACEKNDFEENSRKNLPGA
jgi:hypothetical protein